MAGRAFDGEEGKGGPPSWDGSLAELTRYERDVKWYVAGTEQEKRKMCGPRLARALSGRAKDIIEEMGPAEIDKVSAEDGSGPKFLVDFIKLLGVLITFIRFLAFMGAFIKLWAFLFAFIALLAFSFFKTRTLRTAGLRREQE